jgi:hypothetical protein
MPCRGLLGCLFTTLFLYHAKGLCTKSTSINWHPFIPTQSSTLLHQPSSRNALANFQLNPQRRSNPSDRKTTASRSIEGWRHFSEKQNPHTIAFLPKTTTTAIHPHTIAPPPPAQTLVVIAQPSKIDGLRLVFVWFLYFSCQKITV